VTAISPVSPVVCFSNLDWGYLRYRKQHLMERIGPVMPVVYVNPPRAMKWRRPSRWGAVGAPVPGVRVYEPPVFPGIRRSGVLKELNYRVIARGVRTLLRGAAPPLLWIYSPHALRFTELLAARAVVYDIADDYTVPTGTAVRDEAEARELRLLDVLERRMLARADLVFAVSQPLHDKAIAAGARRVVLLPNGCDLDRYPEPAGPRARPVHPLIGYVGTIAPRVDVELVCDLARLRPAWSFEMVGPVSPPAVVPADAPQNVVWRGQVPYDDVAPAIQRFDACILPLRDTPYAYHSSPIQVFDYLAAGKPVVSSPVAQFEAMPAVIRTARGAAGFAAALDDVLGVDTLEIARSRRAFAAGQSWATRASTALEAIRTLLDEPRTLPSTR
jgi:UDP-galactopyranose mutase